MNKKTAPDQRPTDPPTRPSAWGQRRTVLSAFVVMLLAFVIALSGRSWPILVTRLFSDGLILLAWLLAATGWGSLFPLPRAMPETRCLRCVTGIAAGIGILSLIQLACGLAGLLHHQVAIAIVVIGVALLAYRSRRVTQRNVIDWLTARAGWEWLWLAVVPALAMATLAAFVMPGWLWGDEPHGYDVVEYHLQLPREWYELGRVAPLTHNVFSYFPLAMEMHYLLAMQLRGGPWAGMYLAQLMHVAVVALAVAGVYGVAHAVGARKLSAILAAVAAAHVPWMILLGPVAYNEGAVLLFATLAVGWMMPGLSVGATLVSPDARSEKGDASVAPTEAWEWSAWLTAGLMAGFACGVKLTAVPLVLLIVLGIAAIIAIARGQPLRRVGAGAAIFLAAGTLVFSPWLIRNYAWTRNPVFPEGQNVFGSAHFSETQSSRWELAHSPTQAQLRLPARLAAAWGQIARDWRFGWLLLPLGVVAAVLNWRRAHAWMILALLAMWLIFWVGFTHLQGRFYVIAIPVAAIAIALPRGRILQMAAATVIAIQVALCLWLVDGIFAQRVSPLCDAGLLGIDDLSELMSQDLQDGLKVYPDAPVALVGDARAFLYPIPTARVRYRTVFDVDVKPGQSILDAWLAGQTGSPIIVIDPIEIARFSQTYHGIEPLPHDFAGPRDRVTVLMPTAPAPAGR